MNLLLVQVDFYGQNGLEVTEDMLLSIAAQACLLLANRDVWYDNLRTILLYPSAFKSLRRNFNGYVVTEQEITHIGESWSRGPVILSWPHSNHGSLNPEDGHNVVLHEFAHQFDDLSGSIDGIPVLAKGDGPEFSKPVLRSMLSKQRTAKPRFSTPTVPRALKSFPRSP